MTFHWEDLSVVEGDVEKIPCDCCGKTTFQVNGDIKGPAGWIGFDWVRFSHGHPEAYPVFRIGTGDWGEAVSPDKRWVFGLEYDIKQEGFRLLDLQSERGDMAATYLDRSDIVDTPFASEAFAMVDAVFMKDTRLAELHP